MGCGVRLTPRRLFKCRLTFCSEIGATWVVANKQPAPTGAESIPSPYNLFVRSTAGLAPWFRANDFDDYNIENEALCGKVRSDCNGLIIPDCDGVCSSVQPRGKRPDKMLACIDEAACVSSSRVRFNFSGLVVSFAKFSPHWLASNLVVAAYFRPSVSLRFFCVLWDALARPVCHLGSLFLVLRSSQISTSVLPRPAVFVLTVAFCLVGTSISSHSHGQAKSCP